MKTTKKLTINLPLTFSPERGQERTCEQEGLSASLNDLEIDYDKLIENVEVAFEANKQDIINEILEDLE